MPYEITTNSFQHDDDLPVIDFMHQDIGKARTYFDPRKDKLHIDDINVDHTNRNARIGQALLGAVKDFAHEHSEVQLVTATITSRECLHAMIRVFGREVIDIRKYGEFATSPGKNPHPASASLRYYPHGSDL